MDIIANNLPDIFSQLCSKRIIIIHLNLKRTDEQCNINNKNRNKRSVENLNFSIRNYIYYFTF